jgi:MerR family transcriptional regulator, light-induced transcriptional regulator
MSAPGDERDTFIRLLLAGDRRGATDHARRVLQERGVVHLYEAVIQPALAEVGRRWFADELTIADEHLATATAQVALASLFPLLPIPTERGPRVLVACVEGERHALGALMAADLLAVDGWDDVFLGPDVPVDEIAAKAAELEPAFIALGVTLPERLPALRRTVAALRAALDSPRIVVGGRGAAEVRQQLAELGVSAVVSSAADTVEVARAWR